MSIDSCYVYNVEREREEEKKGSIENCDSISQCLNKSDAISTMIINSKKKITSSKPFDVARKIQFSNRLSMESRSRFM